MDELADIIREATTVDGKKLSNRAIATLTDVAPETINRIMRHEGTPDVETIDKIADALKLSRSRLRSAANLPRGEAGPYQPPEESRLLDSRQRAALDELIRSFVASSPSAPPAPVDRLALRRGQKAAQGDPDREALDEAITAHTEGRAAAREGESEGRRMRDQHDAAGDPDVVDDRAGEEPQDGPDPLNLGDE